MTAGETPPMANRRSLWRHSDFMKLWSGQTISEVGSHIMSYGIGFAAVTLLAATPAQMGGLQAIATLPVLLFGLPAGAWVDRVRRRPLMIAADLGRALLLFSIPIAAVLGVLRFEQLVLVSALAGILTVFFD